VGPTVTVELKGLKTVLDISSECMFFDEGRKKVCKQPGKQACVRNCTGTQPAVPVIGSWRQEICASHATRFISKDIYNNKIKIQTTLSTVTWK
jgi:hypothetical protein